MKRWKNYRYLKQKNQGNNSLFCRFVLVPKLQLGNPALEAQLPDSLEK
jgi:hypothetical protein